jgi:hypothetical protein
MVLSTRPQRGPRTARRLREAAPVERPRYSMESQEVKGWEDGAEDAATILDHQQRVEEASYEQDTAQQRVDEVPQRHDARAAVLEIAEGKANESKESEMRAQEVMDKLVAATKGLMTLNAQRIHEVIRLNKLDGPMVRKSDESMGPEEVADRALVQQIDQVMKKGHASARDAALQMLGEAYVDAAEAMDALEGMNLSDEQEEDFREMQDLVDRESGMSDDATHTYLEQLQARPSQDRMAA